MFGLKEINKINKKVKKGFLVDLRYSFLMAVGGLISSAVMLSIIGLLLFLIYFVIYKITGIFIK